MFKILFLSIFFATTVVDCFGQDDGRNKLATIYFMRSTNGTAFNYFSTFIDDSLACHLRNNRYSVHFVAAGLHKLQVRFDGKKPRKRIRTLDINMEAGQSYYISLNGNRNLFADDLFLMEVTTNTASKLMPTLTIDNNCK